MRYARYNTEGSTGLFVQLIPVELSGYDIWELAQEFQEGNEMSEGKLGCTVMFSPKYKGNYKAVTKVHKQNPNKIKSLVTSVYTKTDGIHAYVCANVVSKRIHMLNAYLTRCGAKHNRMPFDPHIVLWKHSMFGEGDHFFNMRNFGMGEKIDAINAKLAKHPLYVEFRLGTFLSIVPQEEQ